MVELDIFVVDPAEESFVGFFNGCGCGALDLTAREDRRDESDMISGSFFRVKTFIISQIAKSGIKFDSFSELYQKARWDPTQPDNRFQLQLGQKTQINSRWLATPKQPLFDLAEIRRRNKFIELRHLICRFLGRDCRERLRWLNKWTFHFEPQDAHRPGNLPPDEA